jgi:hypothetical protein
LFAAIDPLERSPNLLVNTVSHESCWLMAVTHRNR